MDIEKYTWAKNKQKLLRSIAFVNAGNQNPNLTQEAKDKMIREYYEQIAGFVIEETPIKRGRAKKDETV